MSILQHKISRSEAAPPDSSMNRRRECIANALVPRYSPGIARGIIDQVQCGCENNNKYKWWWRRVPRTDRWINISTHDEPNTVACLSKHKQPCTQRIQRKQQSVKFLYLKSKASMAFKWRQRPINMTGVTDRLLIPKKCNGDIKYYAVVSVNNRPLYARPFEPNSGP